MIVLIFAIMAIAGVLSARYKAQGRTTGHGLPDARANEEALRLRDEVKALKERLAVLERITVEKENSLAREIDDLRAK
jgi:hypothetical protein